MTEQEKQEFLFKALEENGWEGIRNCSVDDEGRVRKYCRWTKNNVRMNILDYEGKDPKLAIFIDNWYITHVYFRECKVFSDRIEFSFSGASVIVRLADGHVFMEYEPEEGDENNG